MKAKKTFIELIILIAVVAISAPMLKSRIATFLNNKAIDYCDIGEIDKAIPFFKKSLKVRPIPRVHCSLANAYRQKGILKEAIDEYKKALQLDPNYLEAYYGLAYSYEEEGLYKEAISYLKKAEALGSLRAEEELKNLRSEYAISLFNEAADFYIEGDKSKAESKLKAAIELEPNFSFAYKLLGDINFSKNLFAEAIANYKQAIELGLDDASIYNLYNDIGISYMRLENYDEALKYLGKAYKLEPTNINILYNLANALRDNRNFNEALEKYKRLTKLKFDYPHVHNDLAGIYISMGKKAEAQKEYKNEMEIAKMELSQNPENVYSLNRLALAYDGFGQYEEARKIIDSVIKKRPDYGEAFYTRARIYENLGEVEKAVRDLEKAKSLFPSTGFIDNYILRLKTKRVVPKDKKSFPDDTIIYLRNGRRIQGRFKEERDNMVFLDVLVGSSFGTIGISREDVKTLKKIR